MKYLSYLILHAFTVFTVFVFSTHNLSATNCTCPGNLVSNPSFENGITGWSFYNGNFSAGTFGAQCGSYAGHFQHTSGTGGFRQTISGISVGTNLVLTFYGGVHQSSFNQRFGLRYYNSSGSLIGENYVDVNGPLPDMTFYTIYSTVPANTSQIRVDGWTNGDWLKVDQICLTVGGPCEPDNSSAPPFCAPTPVCDSGDFLWSQSINSSDGSAPIRLVCSSLLSYTIPGPYPTSFSSATTIQISDVVSYDGYAGRNSVTQQNERWRLVFIKNGITVATSPYTTDVPDLKTQAYWRGSLGSVTLPNGTDEIRIEHWSVNNNSNCSNGPNSVIPVSVCLKSSPICVDFGSAILSDVNLVKTRQIQNQISCGSEPSRMLYISCLLDNISGGTAGNRKLWKIISGGTFNEYCDGKAYTEFTIQNVELPTYKFNVSLIFSGRTYSAPAGNPHIEGCTSSSSSNWYYYTKLNGSMIGLESLNGAVLSMKLTMAAFQLGTNASLYGVLNNFGASAWLDYSIITHPTSFQLVSGCQADFNMFLTGGNLSSSDAGNCGMICAGNSTQLKAVAAGGKSPYSFVWNLGLGSGDTKTVSPTSNTTYMITATDASGCTSTSQILIKVIPGPTVQAGVDQQTCPGGSVNLNATASGGTSPYTFTWSNNLGTGPNKTVTPTATTNYTVTVTDANGCTASDDVKVTIHPAPGVSITKVDPKCGQSNGSATASGSGGTSPYSYKWNTGASSQTISGLSAGVYSVTLTDAKGCTATSSITLVNTPSPTVNAGVDQNACPGSSFNISASGSGGTAPYTYSWNNGLGSGQNKTVSPGVTTIYIVTVTDANGCTATDDVKITIHPSISASIVKTNAKCGLNNGSATADAIGGTAPFSYLWNNGASSQSISGLAAGVYSVTITDSKGCKANASITINNIDGPIVNAGTDRGTCPGGSVTLTASASAGTSPYSFNWSNNLGSGISKTVSPNITTTYMVTVTDANGCTDTDDVTVTIFPAPNVTIVKVDTKCGLNNGSATASGNGGTAPYSYLWNNGATSSSISGLASGSYSVTLTDANGCKAFNTISVNSSSSPVANAGPDQQICNGESVSFSASANGGTSPYIFDWGPVLGSGPSKTITPSTSTTYVVTVSDANGCTATDNIFILVHPKPMVSISKMDAKCGQNNGAATANGNGGTAPYTYIWNVGATSQSLSGLSVGTYSVTLTDAKGCKAFASVTINSSNGPIANAGPDQSICAGGTVLLSANATGGSAPYSYNWSNNLGTGQTKSINPSMSSNYTVTVTDLNGCTAVDEVYIKVNPTPGLTLGLDRYICAGTSTTLTATASGGTSPYVYTWSNGLGTGQSKTVNPTVNTLYTVTVTDFNQCTRVSSVQVFVTGPCACVADLSVSVGTCNIVNNQYQISGQVSFVNPPSTGTLTITSSAGNSQVFSAPFLSPINYLIGGLNSDGLNRTVTATFSADPQCTKAINYIAPPPCKCTIDNLNLVPGPCNPSDNFYTLSGQVSFNNPPATGNLVIAIQGLGSQTFFPPFGSPISFSIGGLVSDGSTRSVQAYFTTIPECAFTKNYNAPVQCKTGPNITHNKELVSIIQTGPRTFNVNYKIDVRNIGGSVGQYSLSDQPNFDDDIAILGTSYTTLNVPGLPGGALAGFGPWVLANQRSLDPGFVHTYNISVQVRIDLNPGTSGNNIYTRCGQTIPGDPSRGEGLFNESYLDKNGDGITDEVREACGDLPYIVHTKTISSVAQTGARSFRVIYNIRVDNLGGAEGRYGLVDQPNFDDDISILNANYISNAPSFPGGGLTGFGPWTLATNQLLASGGTHNFNVTVNAMIDLTVGSSGNNTYRRCGTSIPGIPQGGEGLFNQSLLDVNNDGQADEIKTACDDIPYITHRKSFVSVVQTGTNTYRVVYRIDVENTGGTTGNYDLIDAPGFDDDIIINSTSYTSNAPGVPGGTLLGFGPWSLASNQSLAANGSHNYFVTVNITLNLSSSSSGDRVYKKCGQTIPGRLSRGEGLYNQSKIDVNRDGNPDEFSEACGDIPYIFHNKTLQSITQTGPGLFQVVYNIVVRNTGGTSGNYGLVDQPLFDDDISILNANFTSNAPGVPGGSLIGSGPWTLASNQALNSGSSHTYVLTVQVRLDLNPGSGGDNVYRKCGFTTPGTPRQGEGLFNRSLLDTNNDGNPDEISEVCGDIPYITHQKTVQSVTQTGPNTFRVQYNIVVRNLGSVSGSYALVDEPGFDDDLSINNASYVSTAPGFPGSNLAGSGPWSLAVNQILASGASHTFTVTVNVILDLNPLSGGDNVYRYCGKSTPGVPKAGEGLFNRSLLDTNNDGIPEEISTVCGDIPQLTHRKEISSIVPTGLNTYRVTYRIVVENLGGIPGNYSLTDRPIFDDDILISSASYTTNVVGLPGGVLVGSGPWTLASLQNIGVGATHTYTLTVNVNLDLRSASSGNNVYTRCGQTAQGIPSPGEGLFNRSLLDTNGDGIADEIREVCGDIPYITHLKTIQNITSTGVNTYRVDYQVQVRNTGGAAGNYSLVDQPAFDDDINIINASYTSDAPSNPGLPLGGPGPWLIANNIPLNAGSVHTYTIRVNVSIDLRPISGGDNVYTRCGQTTPGTPRQGEGLFNRTSLDANNDGTPDEFSEVCGDLPYITHQKTVQSVTQTGANTFRINYNIVVRNIGGVSGSYGLIDAPAFDNDLAINNASYTSNASGFPGSVLAGTGPWTLATNQALASGGVHTYVLTVNVTLDLSPASSGDKVYRRCGQSTPGVPTPGEGLFNRSLLDVNNDGTPDEISTVCEDLPQLTHRKELSSIVNTGLNSYRVTYRIVVENKGGVSGRYTLTDRPIFDDDISINSSSFTSDVAGIPGSALAGIGPWTLATLQNIAANGVHTYTLVVNVTLDLRPGSSGNNVYTRCGQTQQGIPSPAEGLFNRSLLDTNGDGIADEIREVCGDLPYFDHSKQFLSATRQSNGSYKVSYSIQVCNLGGASGNYSLNDRPAFDDDVNINSVSFTRNFNLPGTTLSPVPPPNGWVLANNLSMAAGGCDNYVLEFNISIDLSPGSRGDNQYRACGSSSITPKSGEGLFNESLLDLNQDGVPDQRDTACRDIPFIVHEKRFIRADQMPDQSYNVEYQIQVCNQGGLSGQYDLYDKPDMDDDVIIRSVSYSSSVHGNTNLSLPVPVQGWQVANDVFLAPNSCHTYTIRFNLSIDLGPGTTGDNIYRKCGESSPGIPKAGEGLFNLSLLDLDNDGIAEQRDTACADIVTGLGDCVWNDNNYNGIQDPGETGVKGVHVNLYRCDGTWVAKDTTDNMGKYFFFGIPGNQSYYVVFEKSTLPAAFDFTRQDIGSNDGLDSDVDASGRGPCLFLPAGKVDSSYDAGVFKLATIGNYVWLDKNGNGLQDFDEEGVKGVQVTLFDAITRTALKTETTDMTGYYLIRQIRPGNYYLKFNWPASFSPTRSNAGNDLLDSDVDGSNGVMTTATTELVAGETDLSWDLGLVECALIGGRVFLDANADGIFNTNENGINGLRVYLIDVSTGKVVNTFTTRVDPATPSNDGWYEFPCVSTGNYYLQFENISQLQATRPYIGTDPSRYSYITNEVGINTTRIFNLKAGDVVRPINGGFIVKSTLRGAATQVEPGGVNLSDLVEILSQDGEDELLDVFPVPAVHELTLQYNLKKDGEIAIMVFGQNGQLLLNLNNSLYRTKGQNVEKLDISNLPTGQYLIQIRTASGIVQDKFTILK